MKTPLLLSPFVLSSMLLIALGACDKPSNATSNRTGTPPFAANGEDVLVTVNGVPIREADLHFVLARNDRGRGRGADEATAKEALEKIIDQEIARQQAQALKLDADPDHIRKLRFMEAPVNDFQRSSLSERFYEQVVTETPPVDQAEARAYFEANRARLQTEFRVSQILVKNDEARILELRQKLDAGTPFEAVAATLFEASTIAAGAAPWDLGLLGWNQLPVPWQDALDNMQEGEISDILRGPNQRAWIIKLVKRERNESKTFEKLEPELIQMMQNARAQARSQKTLQDLRSRANVVRVRAAGAMAPAPEPED